MVEIMKIMETSFKKIPGTHSYIHCPDPAAGHHSPTPLLETPGHSQPSLGQSLWDHCSFLLGSGVHKVLFVPSKNLFPQSCVSSGGSMVGLMTTSSRRACAISDMLHPESLPLWQATACLYLHRRHSKTVLAQSLWGLWVLLCTRFV